jgi:hypothetical protein
MSRIEPYSYLCRLALRLRSERIDWFSNERNGKEEKEKVA